MTHFIGGPLHGQLVPSTQHQDYRILAGNVHYIRRAARCGRVDFAIYGMADKHVEKLLDAIYSTEGV